MRLKPQIFAPFHNINRVSIEKSIVTWHSMLLQIAQTMCWMKIALSEVHNSDFIHKDRLFLCVCVTFWLALMYLVCLEGCHVLWLCSKKHLLKIIHIAVIRFAMYSPCMFEAKSRKRCAAHTKQTNRERERERKYRTQLRANT